MSAVFDSASFDDHEAVNFSHCPETGLKAIIAVHSTALGPAAGGCRMRLYEREEEALTDVLRLSRGMTYKNAMAELPLGGGKSVVVGDPAKDKTARLLESLGDAVERLGGDYWIAEDMGIGPEDMAIVARRTRYVAGLAKGKAASGDPSPVTAEGIFRGLKIAVKHKLQRPSVKGLTVAIQGIGHVGYGLARLLHEAGASLVVSDVNQAALKSAVAEFEADVVDPDSIYDVDADVFAPCAAGAILNANTVPRLKVPVVAGAANNQLDVPESGALLKQRGILYAPDYVINGGGIINVAGEILGNYDPAWVRAKLDRLMQTLDAVFTESARQDLSPEVVADRIARQRIEEARLRKAG
ncbi:Leu/Phe/Val dehydrogenase [Nisaea sp.]|uniref:Leu/Phe/Val dehydrogenase n=1 Tax=Nisaea sp. TaxID=2024842 RepID=UPI003B520F2C